MGDTHGKSGLAGMKSPERSVVSIFTAVLNRTKKKKTGCIYLKACIRHAHMSCNAVLGFVRATFARESVASGDHFHSYPISPHQFCNHLGFGRLKSRRGAEGLVRVFARGGTFRLAIMCDDDTSSLQMHFFCCCNDAGNAF